LSLCGVGGAHKPNPALELSDAQESTLLI
jgi:hypothetical protein